MKYKGIKYEKWVLSVRGEKGEREISSLLHLCITISCSFADFTIVPVSISHELSFNVL